MCGDKASPLSIIASADAAVGQHGPKGGATTTHTVTCLRTDRFIFPHRISHEDIKWQNCKWYAGKTINKVILVRQEPLKKSYDCVVIQRARPITIARAQGLAFIYDCLHNEKNINFNYQFN